MLIERIYERYQMAQKKYAEQSKLEGFYGSELEAASKSAVSFFAFLFFLAVAVFLFLMLPAAIYYILIHSQRMRYHWSMQLLLIFALFLPNVGFIFAIFILLAGYTLYGLPSLSTFKKRFK